LGRLFGVVDTKNVLALGLCFVDFNHHACQVSYVNSGHQIVAVTNYRKSEWVLKPRLLEVIEEDLLTFTVQNASRDNVSLDSFLFEI